MKHFVLAMMLVAFTACSTGNNADVKCPTDPNKQLTRDEWKACNGRQDKSNDRGV